MTGVMAAAGALAIAAFLALALLAAAAASAWRAGGEAPDGERWRERRRSLLFGLPLSFTTYASDGQVLSEESGLLTRRSEQLQLFRVQDVSMERGPLQRLLGLGTIRLATSDRSSGDMAIASIRHPREVRDALSEDVEAARERKRVGARELMGADGPWA